MGDVRTRRPSVESADSPRLRALEELRILDTAPEPPLDDITALAAALFQVPMAIVCFVDAHRQWFKSRVGVDLTETPREFAFCAHTIEGRDLFVVEDAAEDDSFRANPLVIGPPHIRFYAGAPLGLASGEVVGSIAILDHVPRGLSAAQRGHLERLARLVVHALELRGLTTEAQAETSRSHAGERRARHALSRAEARYRRLFQSEVLGMMVWEANGTIVEANDAFLDMVGYSRGDLQAGRLRSSELTPPEQHATDARSFAAARKTGRIAAFEKEYIRKDGRRVPVVVGGAMLDGADHERAVCFALDRTDRNRAERETFRRAAILDAALDAILIADDAGRVLEANPAAERVFGRSWDAIVDASLSELLLGPSLGGKGDGSLAAELAAATAPAFRAPAETSACGPGGRVIPIELAIAKIPEEPPIYAVFVRDLTERRSLEAQLRQAQKMEAIGRLAGGVAHDFNNLLAVVMGVAQLAQGKLDAVHPVRADLDAIVEAATRAATLTRHLLAIGRRQVLQAVSVDLGAMVIDIDGLLRRLVGPDVELEVELDPARPRVDADPAQLQRVLLNLVVNARDATPAGGRITVRTGTEVLGPFAALAAGAPAGTYVVLSVADTGSGMDAATRDRIFEPFFTTKAEGKGSGLGLAIAAGIVKQSGGHIAADSAVGRGSTFTVRLPPGALPADHESGSG